MSIMIRGTVRHNGSDALIRAVYARDIDNVRELLATPGVDVNMADKYGYTPLFIASDQGDIDILKALLADSRIDVNKVGVNGITPLIRAIDRGQSGVVTLLIADLRTDVNKVTRQGETPLNYAIRMKGHMYIIRLLISDPRTDVNKVDKWGNSPLYSAAKMGNESILRALLRNPRIQMDKKTQNAVRNHTFSLDIEEIIKPVLQTLENQSRNVHSLLERNTHMPSNIVGRIVPYITGVNAKNYQRNSNTRKNNGGARRKKTRKMLKTRHH